MKEATGEFSMTVVTIVAVCVIAGIIAMLAPKIGGYIEKNWNQVSTDHQCSTGQVWNGSKCVDTQQPAG